MSQTVNVIPVELTELRAASTAGGGSALTNALSHITLATPGWGADYMSITPRNFSGAAVVRYLLNPYLHIFYTTDGGVDLSNITDISDEMQDGDAVDHALDDFPLAGTGYIYVGARVPFSGVAITMGDKNDDGTVLTVNYWAGGAWIDLSVTDGTDDTGDSMKQDGSVTWSVPATWAGASLSVIGDTLPSDAPELHEDLYWTRWEWTAALDASIDIRTMLAINRSTAYAEYIEGQTVEVKMSDRELATVQALTNAGTANLVVNVGTLVGSKFE
jgi:hypothetical protein